MTFPPRNTDTHNYKQAGFVPLGDEATARGQVISKLIKEFRVDNIDMGGSLFSGNKLDEYIKLLEMISTTVFDKASAILKFYPQESEIISKELKQDKYGNEFYASNWMPVEFLKSLPFAEWVGWNFWRNEETAKGLAHIDFPLWGTIDPSYVDSTELTVGKSGKVAVSTWRLQIRARTSDKEHPFVESGPFFNEWKLAEIDKKQLWLNWGKFLSTKTPDELREVVLSMSEKPYRQVATDVTGDITANLEVTSMDWGRNEMKSKLPHNAAVFVAKSLVVDASDYWCPPQAVNVPTLWVRGQGGDKSPGITLQRYLFMFMNSTMVDDANSVGWKVLQNVAKGDFVSATKALHTLDQQLVDMKKLALIKEKDAAVNLPDDIIKVLIGNPSRPYQSLVEALGGNPSPVITINKVQGEIPQAITTKKVRKGL